MNQIQEQLSNPVTGQSIVIRQAAIESNGECLILESVWTKPMRKPPLHYHPGQEEHFRILEGQLSARLGVGERTLGAGEELVVPAGEPHEMSPVGKAEVRVRWEIRPALRTEEMMRTAFGLAADGKVNRHGLPRGPQLIATAHEYAAEIRLVRPSWKIQRPALALLAPLARLLGYRGRYVPQARAEKPALPRAERLASAAEKGHR